VERKPRRRQNVPYENIHLYGKEITIEYADAWDVDYDEDED
jgi:hypothetical protein